MPDYPTTVPSFTVLADDVDDILAAHQNVPNDEIEAVATFVGNSGAAQSHNTDVLTMLLNGVFGCGIKYSSATEVVVEAGQIMVSNAAGTVKKLRSKTSTSALTASDLVGGGAFSNSTAHYIYATADTAVTTPVYKISTNASAPAGYTNYRRIGGFYVDGSGNIIFVWSDTRPSQKPGDVIYERIIHYSSTDSTSAAIPQDNTKPQTASEGKNISGMNMVIVPTSTTDIVEIELTLLLGASTDGVGTIAYVAKDSDADALYTSCNQLVATLPGPCMVFGSYVPGAVNPITFKPFFGSSAATCYLNADNGAARFNGTMFSRLKIRVLKGALSA